jgi:hypothetical protein
LARAIKGPVPNRGDIERASKIRNRLIGGVVVADECVETVVRTYLILGSVCPEIISIELQVCASRLMKPTAARTPCSKTPFLERKE